MFHERLTHSLHCSEFIELTLTIRNNGYEKLIWNHICGDVVRDNFLQ